MVTLHSSPSISSNLVPQLRSFIRLIICDIRFENIIKFGRIVSVFGNTFDIRFIVCSRFVRSLLFWSAARFRISKLLPVLRSSDIVVCL